MRKNFEAAKMYIYDPSFENGPLTRPYHISLVILHLPQYEAHNRACSCGLIPRCCYRISSCPRGTRKSRQFSIKVQISH